MKIIDYSINSIPYYTDKYRFIKFKDNKYDDMSVLSKEIVREFTDLFRANNNYSVMQLFTSGTSGIPLTIYWNQQDYFKSFAPIYRLRKKWYGVSPSDNYVSFFNRINSNKMCYFEKNHLLVSRRIINKSFINQYCKIIADYNPVWIQGAASILYILLKTIYSKGLKLYNLKYIELIEENTTDELKRELLSITSAKVANLYASTEFGPIAYECPNHHLHLIEDNVYIENINNNLLITTMINFNMPLIKYDIGDQGILESCNLCNYKSGFILSNFRGRKVSIIETENDYFDFFSINSIIKEIQYQDIKVINFHVSIHKNMNFELIVLVDEEYYIKLKNFKNYFENKLSQIIPADYKATMKITTDGYELTSANKYDIFSVEK